MEKNQVRKSLEIEANKVTVALHSRIDPVKNQMLMVEVVHRLQDDVRKKITIVCSGKREGDYYRKVMEKIDEYAREEEESSTNKSDTPRIDKIFRFVGWCETRDILGVSNLLILPSTNEGFPLSIVEAFHMKVLTARTKTSGFYDQKCCIPISAEDPEDIVDLLTNICRNGFQEYMNQIQKAYQYANEELTVKRMSEHTVEVYRKAMATHIAS